MTTTIQQLQRRRDCFLRMTPLTTDTRTPQPQPRPTMRPETALKLCLSGTGFTLTIEELRSAWAIADDLDKPLIEAHADALKQVAA